jgi:uncharacterized small protein (DUF1192 family)
MAFKIQGEVLIDDKKGTPVLKNLQREATKTSRSFDNAGTSTKHLAKSLLHLGSAGTSASHSFMQLARLGTAGIIGAAAVGAVNKFGEAVKNSATDYYETQKSLADAFETSFKSTSVEEARKGLEATADVADKLKGKITQLGSLGKIMGGLEKLTGINLGFGDTEKELKQAQANLVIQEEILRVRQRELEIATQASEEMEITAKNSRRLRAELDAQEGVTSKNVVLASQLTDEVETRIAVLKQERTDLDRLADSENKRLLITKNANALYEQQTSLIVANTKLEKAKADEVKKAQGLTGGLLGASRGGQQALGSARTRTERENKQANAKTQEAVFGKMQEEENKARAARGQGPITMQAIKEREAAKQSAREAPSLANQIQGQATGIDPSQIASQQAQSRFEKQSMGMTSDLGPRAKLGVEAQSQTGDVMKAITSLVDLMKSATLVN